MLYDQCDFQCLAGGGTLSVVLISLSGFFEGKRWREEKCRPYHPSPFFSEVGEPHFYVGTHDVTHTHHAETSICLYENLEIPASFHFIKASNRKQQDNHVVPVGLSSELHRE